MVESLRVTSDLINGPKDNPSRKLSRRDFLRLTILGGGGLIGLYVADRLGALNKIFAAINSKINHVDKPGVSLYEISTDPNNFESILDTIGKLPEDLPIKIVLEEGEYRLPQWQERKIISMKGNGYSRENARVNYQLEDRRFIEFSSRDHDRKATISFDGEVGLYIKIVHK